MEIIIELKKELGFEAEVEIIDTKILRKTNEEIDLQLSIGKPEKKRDFIGCSKVNARKNYFAAMMNEGEDGLVTGYTRSYSSVVKPMLQLI
jgi:malate dehydrogenase (oxaloacetate-decarboxylating)(NADP+)